MITPADNDAVGEEVAQLVTANRQKADPKIIILKLRAIKAECDKGLQYRVLVGKAGAYTTVLDALEIYRNNRDVCKLCFRTLTSLMKKQPDLLDDRGVEIIMSFLKKELADDDMKTLALRWTKECCFMHEMNRQKLFHAHIVKHLKYLVPESAPEVLIEALGLCRALVRDDDVRVEFGKAHDYARIIANETLCSLTGLLNRFQKNEHMISDVMMTVTILLVREEFCKKVEDAGSLEIVKAIMLDFVSSENVMKQCLRLLKAMAGNDQCKVHLIERNFATVISATLEANKASTVVATAG